MNNESSFEKEGFYRILLNKKPIPIIFLGYMGSGRLDVYSRRNLIWLIKGALNSAQEITKE